MNAIAVGQPLAPRDERDIEDPEDVITFAGESVLAARGSGHATSEGGGEVKLWHLVVSLADQQGDPRLSVGRRVAVSGGRFGMPALLTARVLRCDSGHQIALLTLAPETQP
jgi:hypothetical protein